MTLIDKFLNKLRYGKFSKIWPSVSETLIRIGGPKFAARLTYFSIDWGNYNPEQKNILCITRALFEKDVIELRKRGKYNYIMIKGGYTRFQMLLSPSKLHRQISYQKELENEPNSINNCLQYAEYLFYLIDRKRKIKAILSANFNYWQDYSFKICAKKENIPFLALSREHPIIPSVCVRVVEENRNANYKFIGDGIAVAGISSKETLLEAGVVNNSEQICVTGLPRYDAWRDIDINSFKREYITLLTFANGYRADNTFKEVLTLFLECAKNNPESNFFVKTKDELDTFNIINSICEFSYLDNVEVGHSNPLFVLLPSSKLVINYNSLALVEAAMAQANILIPNWGECVNKEDVSMYSSNVEDVREVVTFANSSDDFRAIIQKYIANESQQLSQKSSQNFINRYIHFPKEKTSSELFEDYLGKFVE